MEKTDPLYPTLGLAFEAHGNLKDSEHQADLLRDSIGANNLQYEQSLKDLDVAVLEHPGLSDVEKMAWREAIKRHENDPAGIEQSASQLADMIDRLIRAFARPDVPMIKLERTAIGRNVPHTQGHTTAGGGLEFESDYRFATAYFKNPDGSKPNKYRLYSRDIHQVVDEPSQFNEINIDDFLDTPPGSPARLNWFIIGEETIVAYADWLFSQPAGKTRDLIEPVVAKAPKIGIDLEARSDVVRLDIERQRWRIARQIANDIFEAIMQGYSSVRTPEQARREADAKGVPAKMIIDALGETRDERLARLHEWSDKLRAGSIEPPTSS